MNPSKKHYPAIILLFSLLLSACSGRSLPQGYQATLENLPKVPTVESIQPTGQAEGQAQSPTEVETAVEAAPAPVVKGLVTSTAEDGPGSLREAIGQSSPGDIITFDPAVFPPDNPAVIHLNTTMSLNLTQGNLTIDASNAGVILSGEGSPKTGLFINSGGNAIMGMKFINFEQSGILIIGEGDPEYPVSGNIIGGKRNAGIGPYGEGNCFGANGTAIQIQGNTRGNVLSGNLIGVEADMSPIANTESPIRIYDGAYDNIIGPDNIIANHPSLGIMIEGSNTHNNVVTRNAIYNVGGVPLLLLNGGNHERSLQVDAQKISLDCAGGNLQGEIISSPLQSLEIYGGDESGLKYFIGSLAISDMPDDVDASIPISFTYQQDHAFMGTHLYLSGLTIDGESTAFSEALVCPQ